MRFYFSYSFIHVVLFLAILLLDVQGKDLNPANVTALFFCAVLAIGTAVIGFTEYKNLKGV